MSKKPEKYRVQKTGKVYVAIVTWGLMDTDNLGSTRTLKDARSLCKSHAKRHGVENPIILY